MSWNVSGSYFEACNCDAVCPCVVLSPPTQGECTAIVGWHIDEGEFDGVELADLNVALAVHSPGHMASTPWHAAVYLDDRASAEQAAALGSIYSGAAGGHPAVLAAHIGDVLGVATVAIAFDIEGATRTLRIGEVADVKVAALATGQGGEQITIKNHPLAIAPGWEAVVGHADHLHYTDHGYEWKLSGTNALISPFSYKG